METNLVVSIRHLKLLRQDHPHPTLDNVIILLEADQTRYENQCKVADEILAEERFACSECDTDYTEDVHEGSIDEGEPCIDCYGDDAVVIKDN